MPLYDCGDPECGECQRTFGPDRVKAIANFHARERAYAAMEDQQLELPDHLHRIGAREALQTIIARWDEFGPEHGFDEVIDRARNYAK